MAAKKKPTQKQNLLDAMAGVTGEMQTNDNAIARVSAIAKTQFDAAVRVAELEDELKKAKADLFKISTVDLPEAMKEAGLEKFTSTDGLEISVTPDVQCGIPAARREEAYEWLAENGFGGIIKSDVDVIFGRDEREKAEKLVEQLRKKGLEVTFNQSVHAQTLKSFVKERMADTESEIEFPLDLFGVFPFDKATVKPTKQRKMKA